MRIYTALVHKSVAVLTLNKSLLFSALIFLFRCEQKKEISILRQKSGNLCHRQPPEIGKAVLEMHQR